MKFTPIDRPQNAETLTYPQLLERLAVRMVGHPSCATANLIKKFPRTTRFDSPKEYWISNRLEWLTLEALRRGDLSAVVVPHDGDAFYQAPPERWHGFGLMHEPIETHFAWRFLGVDQKFNDRPLLFFADEVAAWERGLAPFLWDGHPMANGLQWHLDQKSRVRMGYWSSFATLAWVATRSLDFVAAVQSYEKSSTDRHGGAASSGAFSLLNASARAFSGMTLSEAQKPLRENLESADGINGVTARNKFNQREEIKRAQWKDWWVVFLNREGFCVLVGYHDFAWPSEKVMAAFPATEKNEQGDEDVVVTSKTPQVPAYRGHQDADAEIHDLMLEAIQKGEANGPWGAAAKFAHKAKGMPSNVQRRLAANFKRRFPKWEDEKTS